MNNFKNIKVSEALNKGSMWINVPAYTLLFSFMFVIPSLLFYLNDDHENIYFVVSVISCFVLAIVLPSLWYFSNVVKYKIWASNNVKDIHRFYQEAQSKKLINESNFSKKLEFKSKSQKKDLQKFYDRINGEKAMTIDYNSEIESDTYINLPKINLIILSVVTVLNLIYLAVSEFSNKKLMFISVVLIVALAYEIYKLKKHNYILKINRDYISYKDDQTKIYWKDIIEYEAVINIGSTAGHMDTNSGLIIETKTGRQVLELKGFTKPAINKVIKVLNENKHRFDVKNQTP